MRCGFRQESGNSWLPSVAADPTEPCLGGHIRLCLLVGYSAAATVRHLGKTSRGDIACAVAPLTLSVC